MLFQFVYQDRYDVLFPENLDRLRHLVTLLTIGREHLDVVRRPTWYR